MNLPTILILFVKWRATTGTNTEVFWETFKIKIYDDQIVNFFYDNDSVTNTKVNLLFFKDNSILLITKIKLII